VYIRQNELFIDVTICRNGTGGCRPRLNASACISITLLKLQRTCNRSVKFEVFTAAVKKALSSSLGRYFLRAGKGC